LILRGFIFAGVY